MQKILVLTLFMFGGLLARAQVDTISSIVLLEAIEITAGDDFDPALFIERVKADTTYYKAFLNLRYYPHRSSGKLRVQAKDGSGKAALKRKAKHLKKGGKYWVDIESDEVEGKLKNRKGEYRYYTAQLFDDAFYPDDTLQASNQVGSYQAVNEDQSKIQVHKENIRLMMFNPGAAIKDVPFIGDKMAIFDDHMVPFYEYKIWEFNYLDSIPCYAFTVRAKPEFKDDKTVIKELTSYFNKETMQIMKREYHMKYNAMLFDFDVRINADMKQLGQALVPTRIDYRGFWDIPAKKPERIQFRVDCYDYRLR